MHLLSADLTTVTHLYLIKFDNIRGNLHKLYADFHVLHFHNDLFSIRFVYLMRPDIKSFPIHEYKRIDPSSVVSIRCHKSSTHYMYSTNMNSIRGVYPPKANDAFPPISDSPYFRTSFRVYKKFSQLNLFKKIILFQKNADDPV